MITNKILFVFIILLLNTNMAFSQPTQNWSRFFTHGELDYTRDLAKDSNGNFIVTGTSVVSYPGFSNYAVVTIKYDSLGNQQWIKVKDNPSSIEDDPYQIMIDDSNNVYIFGVMAGKFFLMKYDELGNEKWYTDFSAFTFYNPFTDRSCMDDEGNIYCTSATAINNQMFSSVRKFSPDGNLIWNHEFENLSDSLDYPTSIIFDNNEFIYLTGSALITDTTSYHYITKFDKFGNISWQSFFGTDTIKSAKEPVKLHLTNESDLYLLGISNIWGFGRDIEIIKLDSSGNKIWESYIVSDSGFDNFPGDINADLNGDLYVTGSIGKFIPPNLGSNFFITSKFDSNGNLVWEKILGESQLLPGKGINLKFDQWNNIYVAGGISNVPFQSYPYNMLVLKYSPQGDSLWSIERELSNNDFTPVQMVLNSEDDFTIILTGGLSYITIRYSPKPMNILEHVIADKFDLQQNYPNPFNPFTTISYSIPEASNVKLELYDVLGNKIQSLIDEYKNAGPYSFNFNGSELSSGIYFYRLSAGQFIQTKKMILIK